MPTALTPEERAALAASLADWEIHGETIRRIFTFADFSEAMGFVTRVAIAAERMDHHPDIDIRWNRVTIALSTHSIGALSELDRDLAAEIESFA